MARRSESEGAGTIVSVFSVAVLQRNFASLGLFTDDRTRYPFPKKAYTASK